MPEELAKGLNHVREIEKKLLAETSKSASEMARELRPIFDEAYEKIKGGIDRLWKAAEHDLDFLE